MKFFDRFNLHNDSSLDNQISTKSLIKLPTTKPNWHCNLTLNMKAARSQFRSQNNLINRFQEARTKFGMHLKPGINYLARYIVDRFHLYSPLRLRASARNSQFSNTTTVCS